jgi:hypothetical protein
VRAHAGAGHSAPSLSRPTTTGGWPGDGDHGTGEIEFSPGIDPKATRLDLLPTADTERAVIRVALELLRVSG